MDFGFMSDSIGKTVRLERGGPDELTGKLLGIMPDAITLETNKHGIVYVQSQHVKTISEAVIPEVQLSSIIPADGYDLAPVESQLPRVYADDFRDLLSKLMHRLIRINHGGPNALQGVLIDVRPEAVTIVHDMKDYVHYPIFHIKSITWIVNAQGQPDQAPAGNKADGKAAK